MMSIKNFVIIKTPRKKPIVGLLVFGGIAVFCILLNAFVVIPHLLSFSRKFNEIAIDPLEVKFLCGLFFIFLFLALAVAVFRNDTESQPIETALLFIGIFCLVFFASLSTPMLFLWAHIYGYHLDHYESARHGGQYLFKLNGT